MCITNVTATIHLELDILGDLYILFNLILTLTFWEKCQSLFLFLNAKPKV